MKKINLTESIVFLIFVYVIIETFFYPYANHLRVSGKFPGIKLFNYSFTISDIMIYCFILIYLIFIILKIIKTKKLILGPKPAVSYIMVFILLIFFSILMGLFNQNPLFFNRFRLIIYTFNLYVVFLNINLSEKFMVKIYKILFYSSILFTLTNIIVWLKPNSYIIISPHISNIYVMMYSAFLFCISLSKILFYKFSIISLILTFLSASIIFINIMDKALIISMILSILLFTLISACSKSKLFVKSKNIVFILIMILTLVSLFTFSPQSKKEEMYEIYKYKYLNIGRQSEKDLSSGRLNIWGNYLNESIKGFGVSPYGLGYSNKYISNIFDSDIQTHNILVFFAYNCGFLSAICLLILFIMFFNKGFSFAISNDHKKIFFEKYQIIGMFVFLILQIILNMVGLRLADVRTAWLFWFILTTLLKEWRLIEKNE